MDGIGKVNITRSNYSKPSVGKTRSGSDNEEPKDVMARGIGEETLEKIPEYTRIFFTKGNKVTPLADERVTPDDSSDCIFTQIEESIKRAQSSVQVEMFSLDRKSLVDLLIQERQRGIKVQVVMNPIDTYQTEQKKEALDRLREGGVDVHIYPVKPKGDPQAKFGQINHVKMMIVDGREAIIGGMNWGEHSRNNRDYDVKVEGPAVDNMQRLFQKDWVFSGGDGKELPQLVKNKPHPEGDAMVNLITSGLEPRERTIGKTIRRAIDNAKKSVYAELFVLTDSMTTKALINAKNRGLDVKVILNPLKIGDSAINEKAAKELKDAGVHVKWYECNPKTREKLHAKMGIFDDDQVIVGSANWTYAGFNINREANVEVLSKEVNSKFSGIFKDNWENRTSDKPNYLDNVVEDPGN